MKLIAPIPENEMKRVIRLSELDLDYTDIQDSLKDLTKLAAKVAGTAISLVNLIDSFTQWTISNYGMDLAQMTREDSVCQYTIVAEESFEVKDLQEDERFCDKFYVAGPPNLKYYFGVPLQTEDGLNLGALCVLDKIGKELSPEKVDLLKIIASEIVNRLMAVQMIQHLQRSVKDASETQRKVAHDIRGPLGGIISLAQIISDQGEKNNMGQVLEFISMIQKSGSSLLDLANEILSRGKLAETVTSSSGTGEFNLLVFKDKLEKLYTPQAIPKHILFSVNIQGNNELIHFSKNKLMQIAGNIISNAIKFTHNNGTVSVDLSFVIEKPGKTLIIRVADNGIGMSQSAIDSIQDDTIISTEGTAGEQGYGFGLALVARLVKGLNGVLHISSRPGSGTVFDIHIPVN